MSEVSLYRSRANTAHIRLPRPDSGLGFQVKFLKTFQVVPSSLGSSRHPPDPPHSGSLSSFGLTFGLGLTFRLGSTFRVGMTFRISSSSGIGGSGFPGLVDCKGLRTKRLDRGVDDRTWALSRLVSSSLLLLLQVLEDPSALS